MAPPLASCGAAYPGIKAHKPAKPGREHATMYSKSTHLYGGRLHGKALPHTGLRLRRKMRLDRARHSKSARLAGTSRNGGSAIMRLPIAIDSLIAGIRQGRTTGKISALGCLVSCTTVLVAFTNEALSAAFSPVLRFRSKRGKLLDETSSRMR